MLTNIEAMAAAYIAAVYFTETGDEGQPSPDAQLTAEYRRACVHSCRHFAQLAGDWLSARHAEQAGHDLWLTRNGHGAGFWDRPDVYGGREAAERLSALAWSLGEDYPEFEEA